MVQVLATVHNSQLCAEEMVANQLVQTNWKETNTFQELSPHNLLCLQ